MKTLRLLIYIVVLFVIVPQGRCQTVSKSFTKKQTDDFLKNPEFLKTASLIMLYKGRPDSAVWFSEKLIAISRTSENLLLLSNAYVLQNNCDRALSFAKEAHDLESDNIFFYNALAFKHHECGRDVDAIGIFRESLARDKHQPDVIDMLIDLELKQHNERDSLTAIGRMQEQIAEGQGAQYRLRIAGLYASQHHYSQALMQLNGVARTSPYYEKALLLKTVIASSDQNYDLATQAIDTLVQIHPSSDSLWCLKARIMFEKGDTILCIQSLDKAIRLNGRELSYYQAMIGILQHAGRTKEQILYARLAASQGIHDFNEVIESYDSAVLMIAAYSSQRTLQSDSQKKLAGAYMATGNFAEASILLEDLVHSNPDDGQIQYLLGATYLNLRQYQLAEEHINVVLRRNQNDAAANFLMANVRQKQDRHQDAITFTQRAMRFGKDDRYESFLDTLQYQEQKKVKTQSQKSLKRD